MTSFPVTDGRLRFYLTVLAAVEALIIVRLYKGESITTVVPVFTKPQSPAFSALFATLALILLVVRSSSALSPDSAAAWRTTAGVHAAEALFITWAALDNGKLPHTLADARISHAPAAGFVFIVFANALLFSAVAWHKGAREAAAAARGARDRERLRKEASERKYAADLARKKVENDERVAEAARVAATTELD